MAIGAGLTNGSPTPPLRRCGVTRPEALWHAGAATIAVALGLSCVPANVSRAQGDPSTSPAAYTNSMDALDDNRPLSVGDRLSFRIVEDRTPPLPLIVLDTGEVDLPYIGRVQARGKTCRQLARDIKTGLDRDYYYDATVIVALDGFSRQSRGVVYMRGAIANPSAITLPSDEELTLSKAILRAGGFTAYSNQRRVTVLRKGPETSGQGEQIVVDMKEVLEEGRFQNDIVLEPDDIVTVPQRGFVF